MASGESSEKTIVCGIRTRDQRGTKAQSLRSMNIVRRGQRMSGKGKSIAVLPNETGKLIIRGLLQHNKPSYRRKKARGSEPDD